MKIKIFIFYSIIYIFITVSVVVQINYAGVDENPGDINVTLNRLLLTVSENWVGLNQGESSAIADITAEGGELDYSIINKEGPVLFMTREGLSSNINQATASFDIIRNVEVNGDIVGSLIVHNPQEERQSLKNKNMSIIYMGSSLALLLVMMGYSIYYNRRYIKPFRDMKDFATQIAMGNLSVTLNMDKGHVFGPFSESFDIMRDELKASRLREEAAVKSRKELIAQLSHDIKTPVASIKAMSEVMEMTVKDEMERDTLLAIIGKADQIDKLVSDLFHATLEELEQLQVNPKEISSKELVKMIKEADYLKKVECLEIKEGLLWGDPLRLNQVISNLIVNSYKYANTEISIKSHFEGTFYILEVSDKGGGVPPEELDMIMEKFKRGSNASENEGSGLGLYISRYLMEKMEGGLSCKNNDDGFTAVVQIKLV